MANKAAKANRSAAAQRAAELRAEQERREKRTRLIIIISLVVALAVVGALVFWILSRDKADPLDGVEHQPQFTDKGALTIGASGVAGSSNPGTPTLEIYLDYACQFCAQLEQINGDDFEELFTNGETTLELRIVNFLGTNPFSYAAAHSIAVVLDAEPEHFWELHKALFENWDTLASTGAGFDVIGRMAADIGVSEETIDRFDSGEFDEYVEAASTRAGRTVTGTPAVFLDGDRISGWQTPGELARQVRAAAE